MQPFLALITPIGGGPVDPGFGVPGWPSHPIAPGGPPPWVSHPIPPGIWPTPPGQGPVDPGFGVPGWPSHPIAPGGPPPWVSHPIPPGIWPTPPGSGSPPGFWGGRPPNYVDIGLPGPQPIPGWPPVAMPPIFLPPGEKPPEAGNGNSPTHPIYLPPEQQPDTNKALVHVFVVGYGGVWFLIEQPPPAPTHPIVQPTPPATPKPA